jgi:cytochrome c556
MALLGVAGVAWSADGEEIIKYRISVMKAYAGHTGAAARIVRGKVDYTDQLPLHATAMRDISPLHATAMRDISMLIGDLFPEDSDFGETRAKEEVWSKRDEFNQAVKKNQETTEAFLKSVNSGDASARAESFKALTDSCKACHEKFRSEEE